MGIVARENALFYRVSANGPAGDWYWEVISDRNIIARGVALKTAHFGALEYAP
jgi:hypothetical protein